MYDHENLMFLRWLSTTNSHQPLSLLNLLLILHLEKTPNHGTWQGSSLVWNNVSWHWQLGKNGYNLKNWLEDPTSRCSNQLKNIEHWKMVLLKRFKRWLLILTYFKKVEVTFPYFVLPWYYERNCFGDLIWRIVQIDWSFWFVLQMDCH